MKNILYYISNNLLDLIYNLFRKLFFIHIFAQFFIFQTILYAQESKVWDYPVHAGTVQWSKLQSAQEKLNILNVPDQLLVNMTTVDLFKSCLDYPYKTLFLTQDDIQKVCYYIRNIFNGFQELEKRDDTIKELLKIYQGMNPREINTLESTLEQGAFTFQFSFIEILISQRPLLAHLSQNNLISLLKKSLYVYEEKNDEIEIYSIYGLTTTCLILGRILEQSNAMIYESMTT